MERHLSSFVRTLEQINHQLFEESTISKSHIHQVVQAVTSKNLLIVGGHDLTNLWVWGHFIGPKKVTRIESQTSNGPWVDIPAKKFHNLVVNPWKTNECPLKRDYFNTKYIFQPSIFRGHVSFRECTSHFWGIVNSQQSLQRFWPISMGCFWRLSFIWWSSLHAPMFLFWGGWKGFCAPGKKIGAFTILNLTCAYFSKWVENHLLSRSGCFEGNGVAFQTSKTYVFLINRSKQQKQPPLFKKQDSYIIHLFSGMKPLCLRSASHQRVSFFFRSFGKALAPRT